MVNDEIVNEIFEPIGGNGFFNETPNDHGLISLGTETLNQTAEFELNIESSNGLIEKFVPIVFDGYCGDIRQ